ncbi:MAG TPA: beta-ketoacyl synthase N-terminal-like domain-containing protein [Gammaproteobacteria bacterium]|nr:beta-ketoacyl synthase N-terminal-like domain-containing protein [Gammaproteobacteria bacterium]
MSFEPIAIIGHSCLFPGVHSPQDLWRVSLDKKDCLSESPKGHWLIDPSHIIDPHNPLAVDHTWSTRGGYVTGFEQIFDPNVFLIPAKEIQGLDQVFKWPLYLAQQALAMAGYAPDLRHSRAGVIFANLGYSTTKFIHLALENWITQQAPQLQALCPDKADARNRFMSGLPAQFLARALGFSGVAYTLDAACGSALYALKLACQELQQRRADIMLAGGINASDTLLLLMGFTTLHALSRRGQCIPFDSRADGLLPSEGGGLFVLKRLSDAVRDKDSILGVIRGIGLSNDGRGHGLLAPSIAGQILAMEQAYAVAGIDPNTISYVECHATSTTVGDKIELHSMQQIFKENENLYLGALKSNLGHALTASTAASVSRVLCAMQHGVLPPIRTLENPLEDLKNSKFTPLLQAQPWQTEQQPLRAAVNGFGMGGTNAHLILEQYQPEQFTVFVQKSKSSTSAQTDKNQDTDAKSQEAIAVIAVDAIVGTSSNLQQLTEHFMTGHSLLQEIEGSRQARTEQINLPLNLHCPPNDLKDTLGQQLSILKVGLAAMQQVKKPALGDKTGVYMGMGGDPEGAHYGIRWMLPGLFAKAGIEVSQEWLLKARDSVCANPCHAANVLGAMTNIIASHLAVEFDFKGPCFAVSSEELSGISALQIAIDALQAKEIDMALVGAVDMSCTAMHQAVAKTLLSAEKQIAGDAAVTLVLKRLSDAQRDQETVVAVLTPMPDAVLEKSVSYTLTETSFSHLFGHAHAASGLLHLALAAVACNKRLLPATSGKNFPLPWVVENKSNVAKLEVTALGGQQQSFYIAADAEVSKNHLQPFLLRTPPQLYCFSGKDRRDVIQALQAKTFSQTGTAKLVIVADNEQMLERKLPIALQLLNTTKPNPSLPHHGIYYRDHPLAGEIAFVFASSSTSYQDMGIDLTLAFPELIYKIRKLYPKLQSILDLLYGQTFNPKNFFEESLATAYISWLHCLLSRDILGITPDCIMGHSLGETNALSAYGIFQDLDAMSSFAVQSGLFTDLLYGKYTALRDYYPNLTEEEIGWQNWRVHADINLIRQALADEPYCHLSIINTPHDGVIAGLPAACRRIIDKLHVQAVNKLKFDFMVHCPEVHAAAKPWYQFYHRHIASEKIRVYSCITGKPYALTGAQVAEHMLKIGTETVDFPKLIQNAWNDGVRVFIEHGPQGLCSHWIKEILGDKEYVATHYDQTGRSGLVQLMHLMAELIAAGVRIDYQAVKEGLAT